MLSKWFLLLGIGLSIAVNGNSSSKDVCSSDFKQGYIALQHKEARGIGYKTGYTTLEGFAIFDPLESSGRDSRFMPLVDLRAHIFNHGKWASNIGVGGRFILPSIQHVLGSYLYYDIRKDRHHLTVHQITPGIELLGKRMEYRVNGYFSVGPRKSHTYDFQFDRFKGHLIALKAKRRYAAHAVDSEAGVHLTQSTRYDFYAAAGPYYLTTPHTSTWGVQTRFLGRYKNYISLEASYSYDSWFQSIVQGSVALNIPFGSRLKDRKQKCTSKRRLLLSRASLAPHRLEIPVIKTRKTHEIAINPSTHAPWTVWFVDNTSHSLGTFEEPFPTLLEAQDSSSPNDMIYVFPGDGTSTGMDQGIVLQNHQQLLGAGTFHHIETTRENIKIAAQAAALPLLINPASDVVLMADGNTVSGMHVVVLSPGHSGIIFGGMGDGVIGAVVQRNIISGSVNHSGINILAIGGTVTISHNQLMGRIEAAAVGAGIRVIPNGVDIPVVSTISHNTISGYEIGIHLTRLAPGVVAPFTCDIIDNSLFEFGGTGILHEFGAPDTAIHIMNNKLSSSLAVSSGIHASPNLTENGNEQLIISRNQLTVPNTPLGIFIDNDTAVAPSTVTMKVVNNTVLASGGGIQISNQSETGCLLLQDNRAVVPSPNFGYTLIGAVGATFYVEPLVGNIGTFAPATNIIPIPAGGCGF